MQPEAKKTTPGFFAGSCILRKPMFHCYVPGATKFFFFLKLPKKLFCDPFELSFHKVYRDLR